MANFWLNLQLVLIIYCYALICCCSGTKFITSSKLCNGNCVAGDIIDCPDGNVCNIICNAADDDRRRRQLLGNSGGCNDLIIYCPTTSICTINCNYRCNGLQIYAQHSSLLSITKCDNCDDMIIHCPINDRNGAMLNCKLEIVADIYRLTVYAQKSFYDFQLIQDGINDYLYDNPIIHCGQTTNEYQCILASNGKDCIFNSNSPCKGGLQLTTKQPTIDPTKLPTIHPTKYPSINPTNHPTLDPSINPTNNPSTDPTSDPTYNPTHNPILIAIPSRITADVEVVVHEIYTTYKSHDFASNDNDTVHFLASFEGIIAIMIMGGLLCLTLIVCSGLIWYIYYTKNNNKSNDSISSISNAKQINEEEINEKKNNEDQKNIVVDNNEAINIMEGKPNHTIITTGHYDEFIDNLDTSPLPESDGETDDDETDDNDSDDDMYFPADNIKNNDNMSNNMEQITSSNNTKNECGIHQFHHETIGSIGSDESGVTFDMELQSVITNNGNHIAQNI